MKKNIKLLRPVVVILVIFALVFASQTIYSAEKEKRIAIGGGSSGGGTYFLAATSLATIITKYLPGYKANAQNTGGGPQNINLLKMNKIHFGLSTNLQAEQAYKGLEEFKNNPVPKLRAVTSGYSYGVYFLVPRDSSIKDWSDVRGKHIAVGPHGGSFWPDVKYTLRYGYGIEFSEFKPEFLAYEHAIDALRDKRIDGAVNPCGTKPSQRVGAVFDIATTGDVRFISLTDEAIKKIRKEIPSYIPVTIPPNFFPHQDYTFKVLATPTLVITNADVEDEIVYNFLKTIYARKKELMEIYAGMDDYVDPERFKYITIPFHPAAIKFYKEMGLSKYLPK